MLRRAPAHRTRGGENLERGDTISELVTKLDHSESYLSRAVVDPAEEGSVYTERDGCRK